MAEEKENVEKKSCTAIRPDQKRKTEEEADEETKGGKKSPVHYNYNQKKLFFVVCLFFGGKKNPTQYNDDQKRTNM